MGLREAVSEYVYVDLSVTETLVDPELVTVGVRYFVALWDRV